MSIKHHVWSWGKCAILITLCFMLVKLQGCIADARALSANLGTATCITGSLVLAGDRARPAVNGLSSETLLLNLSCGPKRYLTAQTDIIILASQKPGSELSCVLRADGLAKCEIPKTEKK